MLLRPRETKPPLYMMAPITVGVCVQCFLSFFLEMFSRHSLAVGGSIVCVFHGFAAAVGDEEQDLQHWTWYLGMWHILKSRTRPQYLELSVQEIEAETRGRGLDEEAGIRDLERNLGNCSLSLLSLSALW